MKVAAGLRVEREKRLGFNRGFSISLALRGKKRNPLSEEWKANLSKSSRRDISGALRRTTHLKRLVTPDEYLKWKQEILTLYVNSPTYPEVGIIQKNGRAMTQERAFAKQYADQFETTLNSLASIVKRK